MPSERFQAPLGSGWKPSDVKPEIWPESVLGSGVAFAISHVVVTSIYTLAAATRNEARALLACPASLPSDFLLQKFPSGNP